MQTDNSCCMKKTHSPLKSSENCWFVWMQMSSLLLVPIVLVSFCRGRQKRTTAGYVQPHCRPHPPLHSQTQANQISTLLLNVPGVKLPISALKVANSVPASSWNLSLCLPGSERRRPPLAKPQDRRLRLTLCIPKL